MAGFGSFKDNEYVIHQYDLKRPLMNYVWNARILSGVNHLGGGVGSYGGRSMAYIDPDGKGRCSVIRDGNRYVYIKDKVTGKVFNPGWYPCRTDVTNYQCIHGLGYSIISSECDDLAATWRIFVNSEDPCEIWTITLQNNTEASKQLSVYSFADFQLEGYQRYSDYNSYVHSEYETETNVLLSYNEAMERPHEWFNAFIASNRVPTAYESSRNAFIGTYGSIAKPDGIDKEKLGNSLAACEQMIGAMQHDISLKSNECITFHMIVGATDSMDTAKEMANKLFKDGKIELEFQNLKNEKARLCESITIDTPDEKINKFANYWLKQQVQLCSEVGRDTGKGFRDQLQDAWAVASFNPQLAKEKILETLSYMYSDGRCVRGWLPLDHHIYSDGPTWIAPTVNAYIKETGDADILNCKVKYLDKGEDTVFEHILTATRFASDDLGEHDLVHSRDGDWNDSLNMTGLQGKGESVWTSIALYQALLNVAEMAELLLKDDELTKEIKERAERIKRAINDNGWDGNWYLAAINDYNEKVGSHTEKEGMIYLNSQTWAILTGVAEGERLEKCISAVDTYLDSDYGSLTLYPTYTSFNNRIGRLTSFIPGIWENGTPYCHGGTFKVVADCALGRGDKAYETISKILPDSKTNPSEHSGCEPYVVTNMYLGPDNPNRGETKFAWVTGTAGWMFRAIVQYMLGFYPDYESISFKPCLPSSWEEVNYERTFRDARYKVHITNKSKTETGIKRLLVDGVEMKSYKVPLYRDSKVHHVEIEM